MFRFTASNMVWKSPGTPARPSTNPADEGDMLHPRATMSKKSVQRASLRMSKTVGMCAAAFAFFFLILPTHSGPFVVYYIAGNDWLKKAEANAKSIWTRRNEKDHYYYMTQRTNSLFEMMGLKRYNIGGDDNDSEDITKYRK